MPSQVSHGGFAISNVATAAGGISRSAIGVYMFVVGVDGAIWRAQVGYPAS